MITYFTGTIKGGSNVIGTRGGVLVSKNVKAFLNL